MSIITYRYEIGGFKNYTGINNVHRRTCRQFLGVSKYKLNTAVHGDNGFGSYMFNDNGYLSVDNGYLSVDNGYLSVDNGYMSVDNGYLSIDNGVDQLI